MKRSADSIMKIDMTEYISLLTEACKLQAEIIDRLFLIVLEQVNTEDLDDELPFLMEQAREFRKEFEDYGTGDN